MEDACLARLEAIADPIERFVRSVRIAEGHLSKAQITGVKVTENQHNKDHSAIARARRFFMSCGIRQSKWMF